MAGISILCIAATVVAGICGLEWYLRSHVLDHFYGKKMYIRKKNGEQKEILRLEHLENPGAAGGLMQKRPGLLNKLIMLCLCLVTMNLVNRVFIKREKNIAAYVLLLGGGISNLWQRMKKGTVTDYIRFPSLPGKQLPKLVFNLADFCIFLGSILLLLRKR